MMNTDLPLNPPGVNDVRESRLTGPWPSKSGGDLHVAFALPHIQAMGLLDYDPTELARIPVEMRGLRLWTVSDIPAGGIVGTQFHRLRTEISFVVKGRCHWLFEDLYGATRVVAWAPDLVLSMPPFVLHTMVCEEAGTTLVTFANTLYVPDDSRTHDTYSTNVFRDLRDRFRAARGLAG